MSVPGNKEFRAQARETTTRQSIVLLGSNHSMKSAVNGFRHLSEGLGILFPDDEDIFTVRNAGFISRFPPRFPPSPKLFFSSYPSPQNQTTEHPTVPFKHRLLLYHQISYPNNMLYYIVIFLLVIRFPLHYIYRWVC